MTKMLTYWHILFQGKYTFARPDDDEAIQTTMITPQETSPAQAVQYPGDETKTPIYLGNQH